MTAGIAATRPMAVANSASAMPGATTARLVSCRAAMPAKLCMMPQTVPNRPMKGRPSRWSPAAAGPARPAAGSAAMAARMACSSRPRNSPAVSAGIAPLAPFGMAGAERRGGEALAAAARRRRGVRAARASAGLPAPAGASVTAFSMMMAQQASEASSSSAITALHDRIGLQDQGDGREIGRGGGHAGLPVQGRGDGRAGAAAVAAAEQPGGEAGGEQRRHGEAGQEDERTARGRRAGRRHAASAAAPGLPPPRRGCAGRAPPAPRPSGVDGQEAAAAEFRVAVGGAEGDGPGLALARWQHDAGHHLAGQMRQRRGDGGIRVEVGGSRGSRRGGSGDGPAAGRGAGMPSSGRNQPGKTMTTPERRPPPAPPPSRCRGRGAGRGSAAGPAGGGG